MKSWQWLLVVAVLFLVLAGGPEVVASLTNGPLVGPATQLGEGGIIWTDPDELAAAAGVDVQIYALARCLASEHPRDPNVYLRAVGWAVQNFADERGQSILALLTGGAGNQGDGYFGEQKAAAGTKYASTASDPHRRHLEVATEVVLRQSGDPTGGCTHFFSPAAQDELAAKAAAGDERYLKYLGKDSSYIMEKWAARGGLYVGGAVPVVPPGIDGRKLTLWRRA